MHVFSLVWCNFLLWSLNKLNIRPVFGHTQFEPRNFKHILFLLTFPLHTTVLAENNIFNLLSFIISVSCVYMGMYHHNATLYLIVPCCLRFNHSNTLRKSQLTTHKKLGNLQKKISSFEPWKIHWNDYKPNQNECQKIIFIEWPPMTSYYRLIHTNISSNKA